MSLPSIRLLFTCISEIPLCSTGEIVFHDHPIMLTCRFGTVTYPFRLDFGTAFLDNLCTFSGRLHKHFYELNLTLFHREHRRRVIPEVNIERDRDEDNQNTQHQRDG